jgi:hypothetical protein
MLQYRQASLATPTNAIELTKVDLEQVSGCGFGGGGFDGLGFGGFDGLGFGGFSPLGFGGLGGFGLGGFDGFGSGNTILINVDSINKKRNNQRRKHDKY